MHVVFLAEYDGPAAAAGYAYSQPHTHAVANSDAATDAVANSNPATHTSAYSISISGADSAANSSSDSNDTSRFADAHTGTDNRATNVLASNAHSATFGRTDANRGASNADAGSYHPTQYPDTYGRHHSAANASSRHAEVDANAYAHALAGPGDVHCQAHNNQCFYHAYAYAIWQHNGV